MRLEEARKGLKIMADDGCPMPFGWVRGGLVMISTVHDGEWHPLILKPEDLELLAQEARRCAKLNDDK